eukprot:CAMPEP_0119410130 /NCGR_PEP_ID=MMETSP1335-20130426/3230_1 /TAXON_ID=259385 /ORGANISM="Chrysoculter rhomboideus, Strain RCC1486" /LENGTH=109 /DNA_ID=CAMNT_0007434611 /DNA_START=381 /DNA_END=710 /DNA_ORIENTATION=-
MAFTSPTVMMQMSKSQASQSSSLTGSWRRWCALLTTGSADESASSMATITMTKSARLPAMLTPAVRAGHGAHRSPRGQMRTGEHSKSRSKILARGGGPHPQATPSRDIR